MTNNHYYSVSGLTTSADVFVCFSGLWAPVTLRMFVWPLIIYYLIADLCKKTIDTCTYTTKLKAEFTEKK